MGAWGRGMKNRMVTAFVALSLTPAASLAADWPMTAPPLYRPAPFIPRQAVEWTGLYFGANAGYGWAQGSSNTIFEGDVVGFEFQGGVTTPFGRSPTELSSTRLNGSGKASGAIAGGQIGFNWQAGMFVFGAELDAQWSGQQGSFTVACTTGCTAAETVKIRSITTGRARLGWAFDWLMPYVTAGAALVNASNDLIVTAGGVTGSFQSLSATTLGWTAGAGVEVALWGNWSAKLEYLYIAANDIESNTRIPNVLGKGDAFQSADYRDNILRVGLNYRFGPRGGPGVLETSFPPRDTYALSYDFPPSVAMLDKAKGEKRAPVAPVLADNGARRTARVSNESRPSSSDPPNFADIRDIEDSTDALSVDPKPAKSSSHKRRDKEEDESQRIKRIMAICSGC